MINRHVTISLAAMTRALILCTPCRCGFVRRAVWLNWQTTLPCPRSPEVPSLPALVAQAASAVDQVAAAGLLPDGGGVAEYGSPHGGSWLELLAARGLTSAHGNQPAEVVMDCFGLMHCANQSAALNERIAGWPPAEYCYCNSTRWTRSCAAASGTHCGTGIMPTTQQPP